MTDHVRGYRQLGEFGVLARRGLNCALEPPGDVGTRHRLAVTPRQQRRARGTAPGSCRLAGRHPSAAIWALLRQGSLLWVGGATDGLWSLDLTTGRTQHVAHQTHDDAAWRLTDDRVSVLDSTLTSLTELALTNPWGPAVNTVTNRVYVANTYGGDVWVVDGATNAVLTTINLAGTSTLGVATDEGRNRIYAADRYSNELYVIDGATNTVSNTLTTGNYPAWVAVDEGLNAVYVSNTNDGTISVLSLIHISEPTRPY